MLNLNNKPEVGVVLQTIIGSADFAISAVDTFVTNSNVLTIPRGSSVLKWDYVFSSDNSTMLDDLELIWLIDGSPVSAPLKYFRSPIYEEYFNPCQGPLTIGAKIQSIAGSTAKLINLHLKAVTRWEQSYGG